MSEERYLLCRVGRYRIAVARPLRIWPAESREPAYAAAPVDLRILLGEATDETGISVAFETQDGVAVQIVDGVSGFATIADDAFILLPETFAFARRLFDAACGHMVGGGYPLRLRRNQPGFELLPL